MQLNWGLDAFEEAAQQLALLETVWRIAGETRRRNADRFEAKLGDDAMASGFTTFRNVANLLEEALAGNEALTVWRPNNSLEIRVAGWSIGVYAAQACDPTAINWTGSLRKLDLAEANSAVAGDGYSQPSFDDALAEAGMLDARNLLKPRNIVIAHWADAAGRNLRMWFGFPRDNTRGGEPWLEFREYLPSTDRGTGSREAAAPVATPTFRDQQPAAFDIKMRPSAKPGAVPGTTADEATGA
jgi:hypothetical protein